MQEKGCSLHISQELSKLYPETQTEPILTTESAPGLILATGVLGRSLKGHSGIFLSTDAGITWYQVCCVMPTFFLLIKYKYINKIIRLAFLS